MRTVTPPLVFRIVRSLEESGVARSSADLAREFLGLGIISEDLAVELLDPVLSADSRLNKQAGLWRFCAEADPLTAHTPAASGLAENFLAICAPRAVDGWGSVRRGVEPPVLSVSAGGPREGSEYEIRSGETIPRPVISLAGCARRLRGFCGNSSPVDLAEHLGVSHVEGETLESAAEIVAACWERLAGELMLENIFDVAGLDALLEHRLERAEFSGKSFSENDLLSLPEQPGIYIFRAFDGRALYVGQSRQLQARVCSYFTGPPRDEKDRVIRSQAHQLETRALDTGLDALIAESRAIRRLRPECNTQRTVRTGAGEDGILLLPAGEDTGRWVIYTIEGGLMRRRCVAGKSAKQQQRAVASALAALVDPPPTPVARREDAALAATWRRLDPLATFLRLGFDGSAEDLRERLLASLRP